MADTKISTAATDFPNAFDEGRRACLGGVDPKDAPYDKKDDKRAAWDEGYDSAKAEAARNQTMRPATGGAEGQMSTVTDSKK